MIKCYDLEGNEYLKEPIDARECIEHCGFTLEPPEPKAEETGKKKNNRTQSARNL